MVLVHGGAWDEVTVTVATTLTDICTAFHRGPAAGGLVERTSLVEPVWGLLGRNDPQVTRESPESLAKQNTATMNWYIYFYFTSSCLYFKFSIYEYYIFIYF